MYRRELARSRAQAATAKAKAQAAAEKKRRRGARAAAPDKGPPEVALGVTRVIFARRGARRGKAPGGAGVRAQCGQSQNPR